MEIKIYGIPCIVKRERFLDGFHETYTFTVEGWDECTVTGFRAAKRVISGRLDASVRNTLKKGE